jgi:hypothetical protein
MEGSHEGRLIISFFACLAVLLISLSLPRAVDFEPLRFPFKTPADIVRITAFGVPRERPDEPRDSTELVVRNDLRSTRIVAPTSGTVRKVHVREDAAAKTPARLRVAVEIFVNPEWSVALVFDPSTADALLAAAQVEAIRVKSGQRVAAGDDIGDLLAGEMGPSRLHYRVLYGDRPVCARNSSCREAKTVFDAISSIGGNVSSPTARTDAFRGPSVTSGIRMTAASPGF